MRKPVCSLAALILPLTLAACYEPRRVTGPDGKETQEYQSWMIVQTKDGVRKRLRDPDSATFTDVHLGKYQGKTIVCGHVNAANGFGGKTGSQRFVGVSDTVFLEEDGKSAVDGAWSMMGC